MPNSFNHRLLLASSLFATLLSACSLNGTDATRGPSPIINAADVEQRTYDTRAVLNALAYDAEIDPNTSGGWYQVSEAGFNYIDDQCTSYFDKLFFLNREREATKAALNAFGQTTNAILGVTSASSLSITAVAQAFGLATSLTDIVAGSYLYQLPPATTLSFVKKIQTAYREGAQAERGLINSAPAAYHLIQGYLSLCLPPNIEANLIEHITAATAQPVSAGPVAGVTVQVGTKETVSPPDNFPRTPVALVRSPRERLPPPILRPTTPLPNALNSFEERLPASQIRDIQLTVCAVPVDGKLGPVGSDTRKAIVEFFSEFPTPRPSVNSSGGGLKPKDVALLNDAFDAHPKGCLASGFKTPAEVGKSRN